MLCVDMCCPSTGKNALNADSCYWWYLCTIETAQFTKNREKCQDFESFNALSSFCSRSWRKTTSVPFCSESRAERWHTLILLFPEHFTGLLDQISGDMRRIESDKFSYFRAKRRCWERAENVAWTAVLGCGHLCVVVLHGGKTKSHLVWFIGLPRRNAVSLRHHGRGWHLWQNGRFGHAPCGWHPSCGWRGIEDLEFDVAEHWEFHLRWVQLVRLTSMAYDTNSTERKSVRWSIRCAIFMFSKVEKWRTCIWYFFAYFWNDILIWNPCLSGLVAQAQVFFWFLGQFQCQSINVSVCLSDGHLVPYIFHENCTILLSRWHLPSLVEKSACQCLPEFCEQNQQSPQALVYACI